MNLYVVFSLQSVISNYSGVIYITLFHHWHGNCFFASVTRLFLLKYDTIDVFAMHGETGMHYLEELKYFDTPWQTTEISHGTEIREEQIRVIMIHLSTGMYLDSKLYGGRKQSRRLESRYASERTIANESWRMNCDTRQTRIAALRGRVVRFQRTQECVKLDSVT